MRLDNATGLLYPWLTFPTVLLRSWLRHCCICLSMDSDADARASDPCHPLLRPYAIPSSALPQRRAGALQKPLNFLPSSCIHDELALSLAGSSVLFCKTNQGQVTTATGPKSLHVYTHPALRTIATFCLHIGIRWSNSNVECMTSLTCSEYTLRSSRYSRGRSDSMDEIGLRWLEEQGFLHAVSEF